jgi:inosine/xanthosine triphosphate pyrophosphatase family protein
MKVHFVTTNSKKLDTAKTVLAKYKVDLEMLSLDAEVPEIQEYETAKIAGFSAQYVSNLTQKPCIVTEGGLFC